MEFKAASQPSTNRVSRPQPAPTPMPQRSEPSRMQPPVTPSSKKKYIIIGILIAAVLVLIGLSYGIWCMVRPSGVKSDEYQAVFLTNGQVYFGKLKSAGDRYLDLTDIYYLQVQQTVQPDNSKNASDSNSQQNPKVSLAKLGSELHGPEDEMHINRDQVLFWENLTDNGKVVQAIKQNQNK